MVFLYFIRMNISTASDYNKPINQENTGVEIFVDELVLRRRRQNAERARAYRKRKKDLASGLITHEMLIYKKFIDQSGEPFSKKILHKMQLNAERCRRYREKCKRLKLRVSIDQDTRDLDTNASRVSSMVTEVTPSTSSGSVTSSGHNKSIVQSSELVPENSVAEEIVSKMQLNAERCRRYRQKCKQLYSGASCNQNDTRDSDSSTNRGYAKNRLLKRGVVPSIYEYSSEGSEMKTTSDQHATHRTEWSELYVKENLKIINLVKTNPLVYTSPSMEVRHEMWEQIDVACGFNKPQSKKRWERLLSDFYLHILNVSKKTQPNDGLPTPNKGNIKFHDYYYFKDMLFMMPYIKSIVGDAKLKAIQEEIKKEDNTRVNKNRDVTLETIDISEDIEIPSTSKTLTVTSRKTAHKDYVTIKDIDETPIEIKVDNNVYKIEMSTSECLESPDYDNLIKQNTLITERTNTQQTCSTNTAKTNLTTTGVMTDRKPATPYENLLPEEKSLKAFFDAMLGATQRLPEFHQRRIKGDLMKALRHQGVDITE
ncbi:uncharacterized protein [Bactrocera oleae]|uniref:uncharacterized protein isoform X1 n=2 Tax=Bactrocera oleae TaxID=104688 RepID=UPI00387E21A1